MFKPQQRAAEHQKDVHAAVPTEPSPSIATSETSAEKKKNPVLGAKFGNA